MHPAARVGVAQVPLVERRVLRHVDTYRRRAAVDRSRARCWLALARAAATMREVRGDLCERGARGIAPRKAVVVPLSSGHTARGRGECLISAQPCRGTSASYRVLEHVGVWARGHNLGVQRHSNVGRVVRVVSRPSRSRWRRACKFATINGRAAIGNAVAHSVALKSTDFVYPPSVALPKAATVTAALLAIAERTNPLDRGVVGSPVAIGMSRDPLSHVFAPLGRVEFVLRLITARDAGVKDGRRG